MQITATDTYCIKYFGSSVFDTKLFKKKSEDPQWPHFEPRAGPSVSFELYRKTDNFAIARQLFAVASNYPLSCVSSGDGLPWLL